MDTEKMLNRAYAHWIEDGIFEIGLGILFAGIGTLRAIIHLAGKGSPAYYWLAAALFVFMFGCGWGFSRIGESLKARITYPRTGYTAFRQNKYKYKNILVLLLLAGILGGMLGYLSTQPGEQWVGIFIPIGQGIIGSIIFIFAAGRVELKRFYYLAAYSLGIGLVIGALRVGIVFGISFFYLSIGLGLVVSGGVALAQFLRSPKAVDLIGERQ